MAVTLSFMSYSWLVNSIKPLSGPWVGEPAGVQREVPMWMARGMSNSWAASQRGVYMELS